jgi:Rod binding domain-containing protein
MSIRPPSDIVLEVAQAADPVRQRTALERLARLSAGAGASLAAPDAAPVAFADIYRSLDAEAPAAPGTADLRSRLARSLPQAKAQAAPRAEDAYRKFEAFFLQSFIQMMLPDAESVFGRGTAGGMWRSLMAEKLGDGLAQHGGIGIADRLLKRRFAAEPAAASEAVDASLWASRLPRLDPAPLLPGNAGPPGPPRAVDAFVPGWADRTPAPRSL